MPRERKGRLFPAWEIDVLANLVSRFPWSDIKNKIAFFKSPVSFISPKSDIVRSTAFRRGDNEVVSVILSPTKMSPHEFVFSNLSSTKMSPHNFLRFAISPFRPTPLMVRFSEFAVSPFRHFALPFFPLTNHYVRHFAISPFRPTLFFN